MRIACEALDLGTIPQLITVAAAFSDGSGYVLIQMPVPGSDEDDWFGADHYVEVNDQRHGQFGGIKTLEIGKDSLIFTLSGAADLFDEPIELVFSEPLADEAVDKLGQIGSANYGKS